jgi:hypothetical protein
MEHFKDIIYHVINIVAVLGTIFLFADLTEKFYVKNKKTDNNEKA